MPHQKLVDGTGTLTAFTNCPDDEGLAATHITRGEHLRYRCRVGLRALGVRLDVAARVPFDAEFVEHRLQWGNEAHREQHEIGRDLELGARHFAWLAVLPLQPDRLERANLAVLAEKLLSGYRPVAVHALFVRGGRAQYRQPVWPPGIVIQVFRVPQDFDLRHRFRAVAIRGADAVRAGVASANDHHVLAGSPKLVDHRVARDALVLQRQGIPFEMEAIVAAAPDRQGRARR